MDPDAVGLCVSTLLPDPMMCRRPDFERILKAAAGAGFRSVSLWETHVAAYGTGAARTVLDDLGLTARAIETVTGWPDGPGPAGDMVEDQLAVLTELGADILHTAAAPPTSDTARAAEGFAALCFAAAGHGVAVALEFVPSRAIADLASAWAVVRAADAPNGGIAVDVMHWHHQRGGPDLGALGAIPGERVTCLQLCDAPGGTLTVDAYPAATLTGRPLPGDGAADIDGLLRCLAAIGAAPYVTLEVFNRSLAAAGPDAMAARLWAAAIAWFR